MYKKIIIAVVCVAAISVLSTGCQMTETQKGTAAGAGIGAALGAGIGALAGNAGMGAAIGAGVGAVGGGLVGDNIDEKREDSEKADLQRQLELERQKAPQGQNKIDAHYEYIKKRKWVDTSESERVWVEERLEGDRRIEGHYEDRNVPSGYWQEYEEKVWVPEHFE